MQIDKGRVLFSCDTDGGIKSGDKWSKDWAVSKAREYIESYSLTSEDVKIYIAKDKSVNIKAKRSFYLGPKRK